MKKIIVYLNLIYIIFASTLKLAGAVNLSWFWLMTPIWLSALLAGILVLVFYLIIDKYDEE